MRLLHKNMHRQQGFTIVELMISTTIFSLVLMICLSGIMQITKMYYRGVTQARTRDVARNLIDEIAETVRFTNQDILIGPIVQGPQVNINDSSTGYFCIGPKRYTYAIDRIVKKVPASNTKEIKHALWVDQPEGCTGAVDLSLDTPSAGGTSLLAENMRLFLVNLELVDSNLQIYRIGVGVAYGDDDLLLAKPEDEPTELTCEGAFNGAEFCATSKFLVTVQKRL